MNYRSNDYLVRWHHLMTSSVFMVRYVYAIGSNFKPINYEFNDENQPRETQINKSKIFIYLLIYLISKTYLSRCYPFSITEVVILPTFLRMHSVIWWLLAEWYGIWGEKTDGFRWPALEIVASSSAVMIVTTNHFQSVDEQIQAPYRGAGRIAVIILKIDH